MNRAAKRLIVLVVGSTAMLSVPVPLSGSAFGAPAPGPIPVVQVAAGSDTPVSVDREVFHTFTGSVYMGSGSSPYLTGFADADGPIYVDDVLEIVTCSPSSQLCTTVYRHDFSNNCTAQGPQPAGPIFIGQYLNPGLNRVTFRLSDLCGQHKGSSNIYLAGYGVVDSRLVTSNECKGNLSKWLGGLGGQPAYTSAAGDVFVGADHKIHGTGAVEVFAKVNCSARVEMLLQTRVCNRFGLNCNAKNIDKTAVAPLPDGGLFTQNLVGACRSGSDDYRMQVHVSYTTFDGFEGPIPVLTPHEDYNPDGDGGWTRLTC